MYIIFEGIVGVGKSTHTALVTTALQKKYPHREILSVREPGSTEIAQAIRTLVQGTKFDEVMHPITEAYLYAASRAQLLHTVVRPALERGAIVLSDRSILSSFAFQGVAQGISPELILELNKAALSDCRADIIFHLRLDIDTAMSRTFDPSDKFESYGRLFFEKADGAYSLASELPQFAPSWISVDANRDIESIQLDLLGHIESKLQGI